MEQKKKTWKLPKFKVLKKLLLIFMAISPFLAKSQNLLHPEWGFQDFSANTVYQVSSLTQAAVQAKIDEASATYVNNSPTPPGTNSVNVVAVFSSTNSNCNPPVVTDAERCGEGSVTLTATADNTIKWYDAQTGGNLVGTGSTFTTPAISSTTTYYAENISGLTVINGAKSDNSGDGGYYPYDDAGAVRGLTFNALQDFKLNSVKVYNDAGQAANRTFTLQDNSGNTIATATVYVPEGESRLTLNMDVPAGNGYKLIADTHKGLYRNSNVSGYPYNIGDIVSVTSSNNGSTSYYYFFYDWEVQTGSGETCISPRVAATATINAAPTASFTYDINGNNVYFTNNSTGADSYSWDFGDGGSSTATNPSNYYDDGSYTVTLTASNAMCSDVVQESFYVGETPTYGSLSDYSFIGTGYGQLTAPSTPAPGVYKPYVPDLSNLDASKIIWVSPNGGGDGTSENSPTTINDALSTASNNPGTTIIALDGTYYVSGIFINRMIDVRLISKNKWGATLDGGGSTIINLPNSDAEVHEFSIIGFQATSSGNYFIFGAGNAASYNVYNVYISNMKFYDFSVTIYSGLQSHDWTVDKCIHYNSTASYLWYMMGWHQSVINSVMYNNTWYSVSIRGCFPPDEDYYYDQQGQTQISTRTHHFLADNDWTHLIANNTFGSNYNTNRLSNTHLTIFYNTPSDEHGITEDVYFPPKNVHIFNNVFIDNGTGKKGIVIAANRGINDPDQSNVASVNGIFIENNYCDREIVIPDGPEDFSSIDLSTNHSFVNTSSFGFDDNNRDYSISSSSVLKDAGTTAPWSPNVDFKGNPRSGNPDVGAYEYGSLKSVTGIENIVEPENIHFSIYPNPSTGLVNINLEKDIDGLNISILNSYGQIVKSLDVQESKTISMDLTDLPVGIYFIRFKNKTGVLGTHKISIIK